MAKIFYSLSGEGRGHATQVRAMVEMFRGRHEVTLFTYGDAYHLLKEIYRDGAVRIRPIRGMRFRYAGGRLHYLRTGLAGLRFRNRRFWGLVDHLEERIRREKPDLCLTDFEPALPRAASRSSASTTSTCWRSATFPPCLFVCARRRFSWDGWSMAIRPVPRGPSSLPSTPLRSNSVFATGSPRWGSSFVPRS